ncbi:hypothetical protein EYF80_045732 [Liparis tanakae]|uniref:Uncharacterized protein n=1 Tax=Liparis tanakae TaxID=230148 RepID=A0A4Z2FT88_9TELE|nr:hypothetical protein EYF80_045732 [Liparis tanakae]
MSLMVQPAPLISRAPTPNRCSFMRYAGSDGREPVFSQRSSPTLTSFVSVSGITTQMKSRSATLKAKASRAGVW